MLFLAIMGQNTDNIGFKLDQESFYFKINVKGLLLYYVHSKMD